MTDRRLFLAENPNNDRSRLVYVRLNSLAIDTTIVIFPGSQKALVRGVRGDVDRLEALIIETLSAVHLASLDLVIVNRIAVLALIKLFSHHVVQVAATEVEDLAERFPEVPVQGGVNNRVQQAIAITEPEEEAR